MGRGTELTPLRDWSLGAIDQVLPRRVFLRLALAYVRNVRFTFEDDWGKTRTAALLCPVLKMRDVRLTSLVGDGVVATPLGGNPPEVAARVLSLYIVTHN